MESVSKETLQRLPSYLRYFRELDAKGERNISSPVIAEKFKWTAIQVRKDLASISKQSGKPKTGFVVKELIEDICEFLGYNDASKAVLVGVGQLGRALLSYGGFKNYGLEIVAAFDNNKSVISTEVFGTKVLDINKLPDLVERLNVHIGIITVPKERAQEVCDLLIASGIRAVWNFAPKHLIVPDNVVIKNEDLAVSLTILSKELSEKLKKEQD